MERNRAVDLATRATFVVEEHSQADGPTASRPLAWDETAGQCCGGDAPG